MTNRTDSFEELRNFSSMQMRQVVLSCTNLLISIYLKSTAAQFSIGTAENAP